jgi:type I restriction enzyme S subunit
MRPYFHKVCIAPFHGVTRTTCFVLRPREPLFLPFALLTVFQEETVSFANAHSQGATIPYAVWDGALAEKKVLMPTTQLLKRFCDLTAPILDFSILMHAQLHNLKTTRDVLLPKLILGEVDVSDLDITTEALVA